MTTVPEADVAKIPWIVDLDAHVVEPPDVWCSRLPVHLRDSGPRIEYMPGGCRRLEGASYVEAPGTDGPAVAWWCYEDHRASVKRTIVAAGFPADEVAQGRHLLRDATWLLATEGAPQGHERQRSAGPALLSQLPQILWIGISVGKGTPHSPGCALRPTTTGW